MDNVQWSDTLAIAINEVKRGVDRVDERRVGAFGVKIVEELRVERAALVTTLNYLVSSWESARETEKDSFYDADFDTFSPLRESIEAGEKIVEWWPTR